MTRLHSLPRADTPHDKVGPLTLPAFLILAYVAVSVLSYIAYHYATVGNAHALQTAVRLSPLNADYRWRLGRAEFYEHSDASSAQTNYEKAVALNPYKPRYWLDSANALMMLNRQPESLQAIQRAIQLDPTSPKTMWEAGNMYLVAGDTTSAFHRLREILRLASTTASPYPVLPLCWRVSKDADLIVKQAIPPRSDRLLDFLKLVIADKDSPAAAIVWRELAKLRQPFDPKLAFPYFDFLITTRDTSSAVAVWRYLSASAPISEYRQPGNLLLNPGFEKPLLNGGFDWRYRQLPNASLRLDNEQAHAGRNSLEVTFGGATADVGIAQFVPVEPNSTYDFSGFIKGRNLQGAGGPQFQIQDAYSAKSLLLTDDFNDTFNWREVKGEFHTSSDTSMVLLHVVRVPGNTLIKGQLWIDDLSIQRR